MQVPCVSALNAGQLSGRVWDAVDAGDHALLAAHALSSALFVPVVPIYASSAQVLKCCCSLWMKGLQALDMLYHTCLVK